MSDTTSNAAGLPQMGLLMADVVGSTSLYEKLGDAPARKLVHECMELLFAAVKDNGGKVIKTMGDGILCTLPTAIAVARAGIEMSERTASHSLTLRIAMHWGGVLEEGDDIFGDAVNTLARIAGLATPGEILATRTLFTQLPDLGTWKPKPLPPVPVKGKREPLELVAIVRKATGRPLLLSTMSGCSVADTVAQRLCLQYGELTISVAGDGSADIGRDPSNTLVIENAYASRFHAKVYREGDLFLVQDRSSNGTWVVPDGQTPVQLLRRQTALLGHGRIYFGADPRATLTMPVTYKMLADAPQ